MEAAAATLGFCWWQIYHISLSMMFCLLPSGKSLAKPNILSRFTWGRRCTPQRGLGALLLPWLPLTRPPGFSVSLCRREHADPRPRRCFLVLTDSVGHGEDSWFNGQTSLWRSQPPGLGENCFFRPVLNQVQHQHTSWSVGPAIAFSSERILNSWTIFHHVDIS